MASKIRELSEGDRDFANLGPSMLRGHKGHLPHDLLNLRDLDDLLQNLDLWDLDDSLHFLDLRHGALYLSKLRDIRRYQKVYCK